MGPGPALIAAPPHRQPGEDSMMLVCEACDKGYHTFCMKPAIESLPTDSWKCKVSPREVGMLGVPLLLGASCLPGAQDPGGERLCAPLSKPSRHCGVGLGPAPLEGKSPVSLSHRWPAALSVPVSRMQNCRVCSDCGRRPAALNPACQWYENYSVCEGCQEQRRRSTEGSQAGEAEAPPCDQQ